MVAVKERAEGFDPVEVDDHRAVDADELFRVEPPLETGQSLADEVRLAADMQFKVMPGGAALLPSGTLPR